MSNIIVFVEHSQGAPRRASLEALCAARDLGGAPVAVVSGPGADQCTEVLGRHGAAKVVVLTGADQHSPDGLASDLAAIAGEESAAACLVAASATGRDVLPRVAALLDSVPFADCVELRAEGEGYVVVRPWLAGKCLATVGSSGAVFCATLRPNVFPLSEADGAADVVERPACADVKVRVTATEAKPAGRLDVQEAPVVVAGGRGMKEEEHFGLVEGLAAAFNGQAAVGASRAVVDNGWRPHAEQVGQTGKTVSPQLYIAVGISGAIQHLAGMRTSKVIVAINKDPEAPIFKVADYGLVGDAVEVLPALTEAVKQALSEQ